MADIDKFVYYENGSKKVLKPTDRVVIGSGGLAFEGETSNDFELQLTVTDPTDDRTINFPDEDGDIALLQGDSLPKALSFPVKNPSTTTALTKGQLVYISGHSGNKPEVSLAQSNSSATMPAFGFVQKDIAAEAEGYVVYSGLFKGIDTNTLYNEGDTLYVSSTTAGEFQNTPPSGSNLIQKIGKIIKSDTTNGEVLVGGAGRTNATPNLNEGKFFIGNASNQSIQSSYQLPTTLTNNAILVANSDGSSVLSTDLLTIDTANDRIGIGTSSPARTLHLVGDVQYEGSMRIDQYHTSADGPDVLLQKARGTVSTPTAVSAADELGKFVMYGHNGTSFLESAVIKSNATVSGSTYGGTLEFNTGTGGTTSNRLKIDETGIITFNNAYSFPTSDGTSGQVLQTNGSGQLTFATASSGSSDLVDDTTPQLGGNLDPNGFAIAGHLLPSAINTYNLGASNAEWKYLYLGDSAYIFFGNDSDVYLRHNPDAGLTLSMPSSASGSYEPRFTVSTENGDTNSLGPTIRIQNYSTGATHSGTIEFYGENDGGLIHEYSRIRTQMIDTTTGAEEGRISIYVQGGGNGGAYEGFRVDGISEGCTTIIPRHNGVDEGLTLGSTLVTSTASEINYLDGTTMSSLGVCKSDSTGSFITSDSNLIIETSGHTGLAVQTSDPTTKADYAHIYAKDVASSAELFVQDEAGNVTQISPHNEEGDWIYWSENIKTGKKVKINMEKMIRRLEIITGESFFEEYVEGN